MFFFGLPPLFLVATLVGLVISLIATARVKSTFHRFQQVGVRAVLSNNVAQEQLALLVLPASEQYKFVHVEPDGYVQHFRPRLSGGAHQHLVVVSGSGDR